MDAAGIEFMRTTLKAVSPHYPGFLPMEISKNIDELCDQAASCLPADHRPGEGFRGPQGAGPVGPPPKGPLSGVMPAPKAHTDCQLRKCPHWDKLKPQRDELRGCLDRAHLVFAAESDARREDFERAWLEGAREMYLDVQKAFPLTAPAQAYAAQLLAMIRLGRKPLTD